MPTSIRKVPQTIKGETRVNNALLRQLLIDEEGFDTKAHLVKGVFHIGIGHNLEIEQTPEELAAMGMTRLPTRLDNIEITEQQAYDLFDIDVEDALEDVQPTFMPDELQALGETRRAVILSMVFQNGGTGLRKYKRFIAAVKARDFDEAAKEMLDSKWAREDSPARAQRAAAAMRLGYFKEYQSIPTSEPSASTPTSSDADADCLEILAEINAVLSRHLGGKKK